MCCRKCLFCRSSQTQTFRCCVVGVRSFGRWQEFSFERSSHFGVSIILSLSSCKSVGCRARRLCIRTSWLSESRQRAFQHISVCIPNRNPTCFVEIADLVTRSKRFSSYITLALYRTAWLGLSWNVRAYGTFAGSQISSPTSMDLLSCLSAMRV